MSTGPFTRLPRPPASDDKQQWHMWFDKIHLILSSTLGIAWEIVSTSGSKLIDIDTRPHNQLQTINGTGDNHISATENSELTALDSLSAGLTVKTGDAAYTARTLTAPASGLTISNADGISGNPTFALAGDLSAIEGITGHGIVTRTADDTWTTRTITGTTGEITVTNGDGISGNPVISLPDTITTPLKFGDSTNYSEFEADGTLYFAGNATVYNDIIINPNALTFGASAPVQRNYNGTNATGWAYVGNGTDAQMGWFEIPHDYKEGTDIEIHLHFSPETALTTGQTIIWGFSYDICGMNSATHTQAALTATYTAPASPYAAWAHIYEYVGIISGTNRKIGDVCGFEISRNGTTDTYNGYVHLLSVGMHYQSDTCGSRSTTSK